MPQWCPRGHGAYWGVSCFECAVESRAARHHAPDHFDRLEARAETLPGPAAAIVREVARKARRLYRDASPNGVL